MKAIKIIKTAYISLFEATGEKMCFGRFCFDFKFLFWNTHIYCFCKRSLVCTWNSEKLYRTKRLVRTAWNTTEYGPVYSRIWTVCCHVWQYAVQIQEYTGPYSVVFHAVVGFKITIYMCRGWYVNELVDDVFGMDSL